MLGQLHLIRAFEETVLELAAAGLVHGPAHSSIGQEGGAVGSILGLRSTDAVNGSHRGHHQFLAKALTHVTGGRLDARPRSSRPRCRRCCSAPSPRSSASPRVLPAAAAGSMHLQWLEAGALGTNAIVGGGVPDRRRPRLGAAALRHDRRLVNYFGDGAVKSARCWRR